MSKFIEECVNFRLCAHIDSARGFIDNETFRLRGQPFGNHNLLLVAAAQETYPLLLTGRPDVEPLKKTLDKIALRFLIYKLRPRQPWEHSHGNVRPHAGPEHKTGGLSILRCESNTGSHRILSAFDLDPPILNENLSGVRRRASKHSKGHFASSGADQSGHR